MAILDVIFQNWESGGTFATYAEKQLKITFTDDRTEQLATRASILVNLKLKDGYEITTTAGWDSLSTDATDKAKIQNHIRNAIIYLTEYWIEKGVLTEQESGSSSFAGLSFSWTNPYNKGTLPWIVVAEMTATGLVATVSVKRSKRSSGFYSMAEAYTSQPSIDASTTKAYQDFTIQEITDFARKMAHPDSDQNFYGLDIDTWATNFIKNRNLLTTSQLLPDKSVTRAKLADDLTALHNSHISRIDANKKTNDAQATLITENKNASDANEQDIVALETEQTKLKAKYDANGKLKLQYYQSGNIGDGSITTSKLANRAVSADKIASRAVTNSKILDGAVTNSKIGAGAVTRSKIGNTAIGTNQVGNSQITEPKLSQVVRTKLNKASSSGVIADGSIKSSKLSNSGSDYDFGYPLRFDSSGNFNTFAIDTRHLTQKIQDQLLQIDANDANNATIQGYFDVNSKLKKIHLPDDVSHGSPIITESDLNYIIQHPTVKNKEKLSISKSNGNMTLFTYRTGKLEFCLVAELIELCHEYTFHKMDGSRILPGSITILQLSAHLKQLLGLVGNVSKRKILLIAVYNQTTKKWRAIFYDAETMSDNPITNPSGEGSIQLNFNINMNLSKGLSQGVYVKNLRVKTNAQPKNFGVLDKNVTGTWKREHSNTSSGGTVDIRHYETLRNTDGHYIKNIYFDEWIRMTTKITHNGQYKDYQFEAERIPDYNANSNTAKWYYFKGAGKWQDKPGFTDNLSLSFSIDNLPGNNNPIDLADGSFLIFERVVSDSV